MNKIPIFKGLIVTLTLFAVFLTEGTYASCITPLEEGIWKNIDANTRSITKIVIRFQCQDQILNGQPYPPGAPFYLRLFGKCSPTDCDWGEAESTRLNSGWLYSTYDQGFARRYVYARMSQRYPGKLFVYVYTDFRDSSRKDYSVANWFDKV